MRCSARKRIAEKKRWRMPEFSLRKTGQPESSTVPIILHSTLPVLYWIQLASKPILIKLLFPCEAGVLSLIIVSSTIYKAAEKSAALYISLKLLDFSPAVLKSRNPSWQMHHTLYPLTILTNLYFKSDNFIFLFLY